MKKYGLSLALASVLCVSAAQAQTYIEGVYSPTTLNFNNGNSSKPLLFSGVFGYQLYPNLAVEGHMGLTAKTGEYTSGSTITTNRYENVYGVFVRPSYALTRKLEAFGRVGQVQIKTKQSSTVNGVASGTDTLNTLNSLAWGLGLNYAFDTSMYLTWNYTSYYSKDATKINGVGLGLGYRF
jgi:opacity protein-like surface antigen